MASICILTDSSAQFPQGNFPGINDVRVVPYSIELNGTVYPEGRDLRANDLPSNISLGQQLRLIAPSVEQLQDLYIHLGQHYRNVLVLLMSASLNSAFQNAQTAAKAVRGRVNVSVIDTQTTSVGLGLLVQSAAEAATEGQLIAEIERMTRNLVSHTYMMICTQGLSYLANAGLVDPSQAFVGDMLGLMPIFTLEEGQISAVEKVRNTRGLVDFMQEFVCEFEALNHIAFVQGIPPMPHESKIMRDHVQTCFLQTPFSEHSINMPLAALIGPRSVSLIVVEKVGTASKREK